WGNDTPTLRGKGTRFGEGSAGQPGAAPAGTGGGGSLGVSRTQRSPQGLLPAVETGTDALIGSCEAAGSSGVRWHAAPRKSGATISAAIGNGERTHAVYHVRATK